MKKTTVVLLLLVCNMLFAQSWDQIIKVVEGDRGSSDYFGYSVAISGDYAIVGAYHEAEDESGANQVLSAGSAYIFELSDGTWTQMQKIVASDRAKSDHFGNSVDISGNYAIVGAMWEDEDESGDNTLTYSGSAYIFKLSDGTWTQMQKIVAADRDDRDFFGKSVAISGDHAIVGAYYEDEDVTGTITRSYAGSAYIFELDESGTEWTQMQKIVASDRIAGDNFGNSVSISGNYAIVGSYCEDENANGDSTLSESGSAYIYELSDDTWTQMQKIAASDRAAGDYFGYSVSISGDYAIVGAYMEDEDADGTTTKSSAGSAYIYKLSDGTWTQMQKIVASDRGGGDNFGNSVSITDSYAIVGAWGEDQDASGANTLSAAGSAYVFELNDDAWTQQQKIVASDRAEGDYFGCSVTISGGYAMVGAYYEDENASGNKTLTHAGSAYIFANSEALPVELSSFTGGYTGTEVALTWETSTEVNNYGFNVERKAGSDGSWVTLEFIEGRGAENAGYSYAYTDSRLPSVDTVSYRLKQLDNDATYEYSKTVEVVINNSSVTGVEDSDLPTEFGLSQNYPNPFNPTTKIEYDVPETSNVIIKVYDILGREVMTLVNGEKTQGSYDIEFNGSSLSSGVYIYRMTAGYYISVKKFVLLK